MPKLICILLFNLALWNATQAQNSFTDGCLGTWKGTMYIYSKGILKDSVPVRLTVAKTASPDAWTWKTEYLSTKLPMVKDYMLRLKDAATNKYVTDEGGGIELTDYLFGNKLYSVFETNGVLLTSTYELRGNDLIFEVTSGKKQPSSADAVINHPVNNLQRVVFRK